MDKIFTSDYPGKVIRESAELDEHVQAADRIRRSAQDPELTTVELQTLVAAQARLLRDFLGFFRDKEGVEILKAAHLERF